MLYGTLCRGKGKEEEGSQTLPSQMCVTCNIQSVEDGGNDVYEQYESKMRYNTQART